MERHLHHDCILANVVISLHELSVAPAIAAGALHNLGAVKAAGGDGESGAEAQRADHVLVPAGSTSSSTSEVQH
jgi:hypothetical protein